MNAMRNAAPINWEDRRAEIRLKATGQGWQTRVNELLRADIESGRLKRSL